MSKQNKPKVLRSAFPAEWNPNCPENFNEHRRHIRYLLHSEGNAHKLAELDIARSFERLKKSINPK